MENFYYHITDPKNIESILKDGIKANEDGDIFLFENKSIRYQTPIIEEGSLYLCEAVTTIADHIARSQIFLEKYAMFEISAEGIEGELVNDNVAEMGARFQWIAKQPTISPEYIAPFGLFKTKTPKIKKHKNTNP